MSAARTATEKSRASDRLWRLARVALANVKAISCGYLKESVYNLGNPQTKAGCDDSGRDTDAKDYGVGMMPTSRRNIVLAVLAAANGAKLSPTQLQKALFLISRNMSSVFTSGSAFHFEPYNYGPFDAGVYSEAESLKLKGLAEISPSSNGQWKEYGASVVGVMEGAKIIASLTPKESDYVKRVVEWVRKLTFQQLVRSIYDAYPEMQENSIFRG